MRTRAAWIRRWAPWATAVFAALALAASVRADVVVSQPPQVDAWDTPNDAGGSITLSWTDHGPVASEYRVFRAEAESGPFAQLTGGSTKDTSWVDCDSLRDGTPYYYRVAAIRDEEQVLSSTVGPVKSGAQWFHTGRTNTMVAALLMAGLILYYVDRARRGGHIFIRRIAGLDAVDEAIGRATEMGRKIMFIPGTQDMDNVQTLAGMAILSRVARMTAQYDTSLEVPVSRSLVMVAGRETVREAYLAEGRPDSYRDEMVYYLSDDQFAYAAALDGIMCREKPATIFLQGCFFAESLVLAETGNSVGAIQIAGTAESSQLPFFVAACDYTLIGEELFLAGAYLSREPMQLGSLKGQDMAKALILILLLIGVVVQTTGIFDFASIFNVE